MDPLIAPLRPVAAVAFGLCALAVIVMSLLPGNEVPSLGFWDKAEHFVAYAGLGGLGALACWQRHRASVVRLLLLLWLLGAGAELAQAASPGRNPELGDAIANALGACVGVFLLRSALLPLYVGGLHRLRSVRRRS